MGECDASADTRAAEQFPLHEKPKNIFPVKIPMPFKEFSGQLPEHPLLCQGREVGNDIKGMKKITDSHRSVGHSSARVATPFRITLSVVR